MTEALLAPGRVPGCSGSRNLQDNLSDLRAQVAANQKGIQLVTELIRHHGLPVVQAYMAHIQVRPTAPWGHPRTPLGTPGPTVTPPCAQANAEVAVREMLKDFAAHWGTAVEAEDFMDDGTPIRLRVQVDPQEVSGVSPPLQRRPLISPLHPHCVPSMPTMPSLHSWHPPPSPHHPHCFLTVPSSSPPCAHHAHCDLITPLMSPACTLCPCCGPTSPAMAVTMTTAGLVGPWRGRWGHKWCPHAPLLFLPPPGQCHL